MNKFEKLNVLLLFSFDQTIHMMCVCVCVCVCMRVYAWVYACMCFTSHILTLVIAPCADKAKWERSIDKGNYDSLIQRIHVTNLVPECPTSGAWQWKQYVHIDSVPYPWCKIG